MAITWRTIAAPDFSSAAAIQQQSGASFQSALDRMEGMGKEQGQRLTNKATDQLTSSIAERLGAGETASDIRTSLLKDRPKNADMDIALANLNKLDKENKTQKISSLNEDIFNQMKEGKSPDEIMGNLYQAGMGEDVLNAGIGRIQQLQQLSSQISTEGQAELASLQGQSERALADYDFETNLANQNWANENPIDARFGIVDDNAQPVNFSTDSGIADLIDETADQWGWDTMDRAGGKELIPKIQNAFKDEEDVIPGLLKLAIAETPRTTTLGKRGISANAIKSKYDELKQRYKETRANQQERSRLLSEQRANRNKIEDAWLAKINNTRAGYQAQTFSNVFGT